MWGAFLLVLSINLLRSSVAVELAFELPDSSVQCFYEEVLEGTKITFQFQVLYGGKRDVDLVITGPTRLELYKDKQKQFNSMVFKAPSTGVYSACFSNEFSTFSHKLVYMHFMLGKDPLLNNEAAGNQTATAAVTKMEYAIGEIRTNLNTVIEYQTRARLRENHARRTAQDLNSRVMWHSTIQSLAICSIFFACVHIVKSFFSDRGNIR